MKLSLAARVTAAFLLLVLLLTFGSVALVAISLRTSVEERLSRSLEGDISSWRTLLEQEGRVLSVAAHGAVNGPALRAVLASEGMDRETLEGIAAEQRGLIGVDLLLLTGPKGKVRAGSLSGTPPGDVSALLDRKQPGPLVVEQVPYWSVIQAVEANGRTVGYLVLGVQVGENLLRRLREQGGAEALLLLDDGVSANSLHSASAEEVLKALPEVGDSPHFLERGGSRILVTQMEMGEGLRLVLTRSADEELARYRATLLSLMELGAGAALGAGLLGFLIVRRVTGPLRQLTAATARVVAEGDFRGTLEVNSQDEIGELATSFGRMMDQLREILLVLDASAAELEHAGSQLSSDAAAQNRTATRQASALYETQVTAQELQRSSQLAAQRAQAILKGAERADSLGRAGERAIESSVGGLTFIRDQVDQIALTSHELQQRTLQIGGITQTVKDLADQSNMLALNAAIEAVRSGEHGKGFAVVAREIRTLADQSVGATARVQEILEDIRVAISNTVETSENGAREVEGGLSQVRATGESLRALASLVHENGVAVREIAETVSRQDVGIAQLFDALKDLSSLSQETVTRLQATEQAASRLSAASGEVRAMVRRYKL
ncbi:methyl-accepting chemotaxis protein [Hyalangium minutum]|uniref:Methyl-accepting chemotaxis protein n=1 Tax=Hyalangium minutum TaxID=394096 RepID=A0A085WIY5_9BACT|nr:methyl-accepting chemotaxis protein [Hyalangium minutum]KFE67648.1 Methyl-accepting chemotaxis protein [Hyalangium minutum]